MSDRGLSCSNQRGNEREPGPKPVPQKRHSGEAIDQQTSSTSSDSRKPLPYAKRRTCGSSRPGKYNRYELRKAILAVILDATIREYGDPADEPEDKEVTEEEEGKLAVVVEVTCMWSDADFARFREEDAQKAKKPKTEPSKEETDRRTIEEALEALNGFRLTFSVKDIVDAVSKDERVTKHLRRLKELDEPVVSPKAGRPKASTSGFKPQLGRHGFVLASSHASVHRSKNTPPKAEPANDTSEPRKVKRGKSKKEKKAAKKAKATTVH